MKFVVSGLKFSQDATEESLLTSSNSIVDYAGFSLLDASNTGVKMTITFEDEWKPT